MKTLTHCVSVVCLAMPGWLATACVAGEFPSSAVESAVKKEIETGLFPGAVVLLGDESGSVYHAAYGHAKIRPSRVAMRKDTLFDMASVTKVVATSTACAILYDRGKLDLDAPMTRYLPDHKGQGVEKINLRRLASHTSGFAADPRIGQQGKGAAFFRVLLSESPKWKVNERYQYACKGTIMLSTIVERISGRPFGEFCHAEILKPLEMNETVFNRVEQSKSIAATHDGIGTSHNIDTKSAGCAIGNAGMFSNASDLSNFCQMMLSGGVWKGRRVLSEKAIADFTKTDQLPQFPARAFLWETDPDSLHRSKHLTSKAYGHSGYTGQSIWVDPGLKIYLVVLTNRTVVKNHREIKDEQYRARARIADSMLESYRTWKNVESR